LEGGFAFLLFVNKLLCGIELISRFSLSLNKKKENAKGNSNYT